MKKIIIVFGIGVIVLCCLLYTYAYLEYRQRAKDFEFDNFNALLWLDDSVKEFYYDHGEYPLGHHPLAHYYENDSVILSKYAHLGNIYGDGFSLNQDELFVYYPIYNRSTGKRESFIVLSRGIDRKLNNVLSEEDSLYLDCWWDQLKLYNTEEIICFQYKQESKNKITWEWLSKQPNRDEAGILKNSGWVIVPPFNVFDYYFGKKDYAIMLDTLRIDRIPEWYLELY